MISTPVSTESLALFIGLAFLAAGIGILRQPRSYKGVVEELHEGLALSLLAGLFAITLGAAIVSVHNMWTGPLAIAVTLVGWASLVKGVLLLSAKNSLLKLAAQFTLQNRMMSLSGLAMLALGLWMVASALI